MPKLYFTSLALILCLHVCAQDNTRFTSYGVNEGLPQSTIYDITQDKDGFMWMGSAGGLARFDGNQFKTYKTSATNPKAISGYKEFRFYNDRSGKLWIVSFNGISIYNQLTDNFTNVLVYTPKNVVIAENHFYGEDDHFIWVGLCSYGIVKVNKQTLKVVPTVLTITSFRTSVNTGYHGFLDNNKLWNVDNNESALSVFSIYDTKTQRSDTISIPVTNILNLNDSEVFGIDLRSAFIINKKTLQYKTVFINENKSEHGTVSMLQQSAEEIILSSSTQGLFYFNTRSLKVTRHIIVRDPQNKNSFLYAGCTYRDWSGNTWIGTRNDGVEKISYPFKKFRWYHSDFAKNNNVFGLYADADNLYVGSLGQGISIYSRENGFIKNIVVNKNIPSAQNSAYAIRPLSKDSLFMIATNAKTNGSNIPFIYSKKEGSVKAIGKEVQKMFTDCWGRGNARHFIWTDRGDHYITNAGECLIAIERCGNTFCSKISNRFPGETLTCCFRDREGDLWTGCFKGAYHQTKDGWQKVAVPNNKEIKTISQDPDGNMWMGTNDEIFVMNKEYRIIKKYNEENGLVNGHIYGLLSDNEGNIWFSHNKGLSVYRWKKKKFEHFSQEDGLQSSEFNVGAYYKAENGELFFGGINGVTSFFPNEIVTNSNVPAVKITGIKLFDQPLQTDSAYWKIRSLTLPYTENSISFEYTLPEYTNTGRNRYSYIMEGVDNTWIDAGDRHFTRYAGLQPGRYTFKVKAANNDGVWSKEPTVIFITIVPPFWQRTWFIILLFLLFVFLSVGIGIYIQKIRQRKAIEALEVQHKIQLERERISRDLHDNVGTQLSLMSKNIQGVIDPLRNISDEEKTRNLNLISQTSKEVIFTLRETIWALNKEEITLEELSDKLKLFTQKLLEIHSSCRLLFTEEIDEHEVLLGPSEAIHLFRICQEAISNSLKYAEASVIEIIIQSMNNKYSIIIKDNGIGFASGQTQTSAHYGLDNMKFRAEEISCIFSLDSTVGKGTTVSISKK